MDDEDGLDDEGGGDNDDDDDEEELGESAKQVVDRLLEDEIRRRIEEFRQQVATEARRRVAERRAMACIPTRSSTSR